MNEKFVPEIANRKSRMDHLQRVVLPLPSDPSDPFMIRSPLSKHWIGTSYAETFEVPKCSYCTWQREKCPKTGRLHWQFYIVFVDRKRLEGVRKVFPGAHMEIARDIRAARDYCRKVETRVDGPWEQGTVPNVPLELNKYIVNSITGGVSTCDLVSANPGLWRNVRQMESLRESFLQHRSSRPRSVLLTGETGKGKTTLMLKIASYVGMNNVYVKDGSQWWDGYAQQELVLWDEFRGAESLPVTKLLTLLSPMPIRVERKGGSVPFRSAMIIFASNLKADAMYASLDWATAAAVVRRFDVFNIY